MFTPVLEQCPKFVEYWDAFISDYGNESELESLPLYLIGADFARYIVKCYIFGDLEEVQIAFNIIENWIVDGDEYVQNCAIIGVLEQLQNSNITGTINPEQFLQFAGSATQKYWVKIIDFWEKGILITDK